MTEVAVWWYDLPAEGKGINRGYWDQGTLERYFAGDLHVPGYTFEHHESRPDASGAVVVVPARYHLDPAQLNADLADFDWCVVLLTSDEETLHPGGIEHPNHRLWRMTPKPGMEGDRWLGEYVPPHLYDNLPGCEPSWRHDWFYAGQVNHQRRKDLLNQLKRMGGGEWHRSRGFTQGYDPAEYAQRLTDAKVIPAPSGPATPDSFRIYEALEAGCVPIADAYAPGMVDPGYWDMVCPGHPFPVIESWSLLPEVMAETLADWPALQLECWSWWQRYTRNLAYRLDDDIRSVSGIEPDHPQITVVVPSSPIPSHPSTEVIEETLASVTDRLRAEIIVCFDGPRPELTHRADDYRESIQRFLWKARQWPHVTPIVSRDHLHQGNLTRLALEHVRTPYLLFVEHDTPLVGEIPWDGLCAALETEANLIRLHHEASILAPHRHLMLDQSAQMVGDVPLRRTAQWSQRPHLARTDFYRSMIETYFGRESRTMIEDVMHGVVDAAWRTRRVAGWADWKLWIYSPDGDMKRSTHLDGRGADPKFDDRFVYAYDGDIPAGAPYPTALRVD